MAALSFEQVAPANACCGFYWLTGRHWRPCKACAACAMALGGLACLVGRPPWCYGTCGCCLSRCRHRGTLVVDRVSNRFGAPPLDGNNVKSCRLRLYVIPIEFEVRSQQATCTMASADLFPRPASREIWWPHIASPILWQGTQHKQHSPSQILWHYILNQIW